MCLQKILLKLFLVSVCDDIHCYIGVIGTYNANNITKLTQTGNNCTFTCNIIVFYGNFYSLGNLQLHSSVIAIAFDYSMTFAHGAVSIFPQSYFHIFFSLFICSRHCENVVDILSIQIRKNRKIKKRKRCGNKIEEKQIRLINKNYIFTYYTHTNPATVAAEGYVYPNRHSSGNHGHYLQSECCMFRNFNVRHGEPQPADVMHSDVIIS